MWLSYSDLRRNIICSHNVVILNLNPIQKTDFSCEPFRNSFARWRRMMQLGTGGLGSTLQTYLRLPMLGNNVRCFCSKIPFLVIFLKSQTFDFAKRYSCLFIKENFKQILQIWENFNFPHFSFQVVLAWCCEMLLSFQNVQNREIRCRNNSTKVPYFFCRLPCSNIPLC